MCTYLFRWTAVPERSARLCLRWSVCLLIPVLVISRLPVQADELESFDLVIRGGRIVDGTGNPWTHGDIAVRGERIVSVGVRIPAGAGKREIDARDLIVAPGFIDIHSHSDLLLLEDGSARARFGRA